MLVEIYITETCTGIHGLPRAFWDGIEGKVNVNSKSGMGYCEHSMSTFPTWHRPYLAMLEVSSGSCLAIDSKAKQH